MNKNLSYILEKIEYWRRHFINPEKFCHDKFVQRLGYEPDFKNPKTFNEKMQWLKLNGDYSKESLLVDKAEVKKYVAEILGEEYLIPTLAVYDSVSEINLDDLPEKFVLKCTHDSASVVICNDKSTFDFKEAKKKLKHCMKINYYYMGFEPVYKDLKPRIIAEKHMAPDGETAINDYKFFCFDGKPEMMFVATDRSDDCRFDFFDMDFNHLEFENIHKNSSKIIEKPEKFEEMKDLSAKLSQGMKFVRIDFYEINGKIYFGEYTFFHGSGYGRFEPVEYDLKVGELLKLD